MKRSDNQKITGRIFAIFLTLMMTISLTVPSFIEAYAVDGEPVVAEESEGAEDSAAEDEKAAEEGAAASSEDAAVEDESAEAAKAAEDKSAGSAESVDGEASDKADGSVDALKAGGLEVQKEEGELKSITLNVVKTPTGGIDFTWTAAEGAASYRMFSSDHQEVAPQTVKSDAALKCSFTGLKPSTLYAFNIEAYDANGTKIAEGKEIVKTYGTTFDESQYRSLGSTTLPALNTGLSLRTLLGESNDGYAVAQGAASDGTFAYYMMASSSNQKGRVLKIRMSDNSVAAAGPVIDIHHANGMTYDSKRNRLVCVGYGSYRHQLTFIDPDSLTIALQQDVTYNPNMDGYGYTPNGMAAIAYVAKYDVYVTRERGDQVSGGNNDIMVFKPKDNDPANVRNTVPKSVDIVGYVRTKITSDYPETYQSMDADEKYVYFLLSPGSGQPGNIILTLDWNSEELLPVINGDQEYIKKIWYCNNDGSGRPDAVLTIPIANESEGLFHTTDASGNEHFYVSEYYGRWKYKTVTKKKKVKVKWKKVRKWYNKKTKKWTTKKPKKKYRGKSKKVWKYKYKKKKVKETVKDYWARDDYVYDLGII